MNAQLVEEEAGRQFLSECPKFRGIIRNDPDDGVGHSLHLITHSQLTMYGIFLNRDREESQGMYFDATGCVVQAKAGEVIGNKSCGKVKRRRVLLLSVGCDSPASKITGIAASQRGSVWVLGNHLGDVNDVQNLKVFTKNLVKQAAEANGKTDEEMWPPMVTVDLCRVQMAALVEALNGM